MTQPRASLGAFVSALVLVVLAAVLLLPPAPGETDTFAYMDPGVNLAKGQGLTSRLNYGNPSDEPRLFAGYPPGFPVLYAAYAAWAGTGVVAQDLFRWLTASVLTLIAFVILRRPFEGDRFGEFAVALLLLLALPSRFVLLSADRPDVAGLSVALLALLPRPQSPGRLALAALTAGLALVISPICGLLAAAGIALRWILVLEQRPALLPTAAIGGVGMILPAGAALLFGTVFDAEYGERLSTYLFSGGAEAAAGITTGAGDFFALLRGEFATWWRAFSAEGLTTPHAWARLMELVIVVLTATVLLVRAASGLGAGRTAWALVAVWITALLSLSIVPWNRLYAALAAGLLLCALAAALPARVWDRGARRILLAGLALTVAVQLPFSALSLYSLAGMRDSFERMQATVARLDFRDRTGEGQAIVQLDGSAYFLFKPLDVIPIPSAHPLASTDEMLRKSDYFVLGYGGSGNPLQPHRPPWWPKVAEQVELLYRPTLPQQPSLFGFPLSNSSQTWEVEIWGRKKPPSD